MKVHHITMTIAFFCMSLAVAAQPLDEVREGEAQSGAPGPRAHIVQRTVDLGEVREGEIATAVFTVENRGDADLIINNVQATCGCTTVQLSDEERVIPPGGRRDIEARFDTAERLGTQRKPIMLMLNDPQESQITLTLVAEVVSLFKVLPAPLIHLRSAQRGAQLPPIDLFPYERAARFEDLKVQVPAGILDYHTTPIEDPLHGHGIRIVFRVPDDVELGTVSGDVHLHGTVDGEEATLPVRVAGQVIGDLVARPISLQALTPVSRGLKLAPVTIASANDRPFEIWGVDAGPHLEAAAEPHPMKKTWTVRATVRDSAPDGPMGIEMVIRTDNTGQPLVTIPVFVNVRPRYVLEPAVALLGPSLGGTRNVRIRADRGTLLDIRAISCDHPHVIAEPAADIVSEQDHIRYVRVGLRDTARVDADFSAEVKVETNIPGAGTVIIPVSYRASAPRE